MMKTIWRQIELWLAENAPHFLKKLAVGATISEIEQAEKAIGCRLPRFVKDSYLIHDGAVEAGLFGEWNLLSLELMIDEWNFLKGLKDQNLFDIGAGTNSDFIKPVWWHERWIPVFYDACGNYLCLDLAPKGGGTRGQIVAYYHDESKRYLIAESFKSYLQTFAGNLAADNYFVNKYGALTLKDN